MSEKRLVGRAARIGIGVLVAVSLASVAAAAALGAAGSDPGNVVSGRTLFTSSGCGACHVFKAARATGRTGPDLDTVRLSEAKIATAIGKGGAAIIGKAAAAKYKVRMPAYKGKLSTGQIADVAAFVYADRDKAAAAQSAGSTSTTTSTTPGGSSTTGASSSSGSTGGSTTTTSSSGGVTDTADDCPPGQTIPQGTYAGDGDEDNSGSPTDGDGCL